MVCNWGMSDKLGMIEYGEGQGEVFLARDISSPRNYSEETAKTIDDEVKKLTDEAYAEATRLITEHRDKLEAIAKALLLYETIDGKHIEEIMEHGEIQNPPSDPTPPDLPEEEEKKTPVVDDKEKESDGDFGGELQPA